MAQEENASLRMLKKSVPRGRRRIETGGVPHGYVEDFDEPRTKLAGFFSILLAAKGLLGLSQLAFDHSTEHGQSLRRGGFET
jgi:hypothetical protein